MPRTRTPFVNSCILHWNQWRNINIFRSGNQKCFRNPGSLKQCPHNNQTRISQPMIEGSERNPRLRLILIRANHVSSHCIYYTQVVWQSFTSRNKSIWIIGRLLNVKNPVRITKATQERVHWPSHNSWTNTGHNKITSTTHTYPYTHSIQSTT